MDSGGPSTACVASRKRQRDTRLVRSKQKKRLHILTNHELKAFSGWEAAPVPWSFAQCAKYIGWCHVGHLWPYSRYSQSRRTNKANLNYCTNEVFVERCIQACQYIYDEAKVRRNQVNLSILRMVYAEVVLAVPVDWRTMEIQTNSKMAPLLGMTIPYERKFAGEALGKKASEVEIPNENVEWSETSSEESDTRCDSGARSQKEFPFDFDWVDDIFNKERPIPKEDGKEGDVSESDAVPDKGVDNNQESAKDGSVSRDIYLELQARHEQSLKIIEALAEEVQAKENEVQECHEELQELKEQLREKDRFIANLMP
jgi:hypothetical protein